MQLKKLLSTALIGAMAVTMLAGCGGSSEPEDTSAAPAAESTSTAEDTPSSDFDGFDETINIDMWGMSFFGDSGTKEVIGAINDISKEACNVTITWHPCDVATYMQQVPMMMTDAKGPDLILCTAIPVVGFQTLTSQSQLADLSELLPTYAPDAYEMMKEYLPATTINGKIYALPCYRMYNASYNLIMRKDVLDTLGLTEKAQNIKSWSEYEAILQEVHDRQSELPEDQKTPWMIGSNSAEGDVVSSLSTWYVDDEFAKNSGFDTLQDSKKLIYVDSETNKVSSYFETEAYRKPCERAYDMMQKGLVHPDSQTLTDGGDNLLATGSIFSYHTKGEEHVKFDKQNATGKELVVVKTIDIPIQSFDVSTWAWAVPSNSQNQEAAVAFMNVLFTNADVENLFVYGIEGRDYELVDGEVKQLDTMEYQCSDFFFGNQFAAYPTVGMGADFRQISEQHTKEAPMSKYYGLVIDTSSLSNELTAIQAVIAKYGVPLTSGTVDPDDPTVGIDAFNAALKDAGVDTVIAEYQRQLDAWLAEQ